MNIFRRYDPRSYWARRKNPNNTAGEIPERIAFDIDYIRSHLKATDKVLEIGPGVGRILAAYQGVTSLHTVDVTDRYRCELLAKAEELNLSLEDHYLRAPGDMLPFESGEFNVSVCCQVLLHMNNELAKSTIIESLRVARKMIVICGGYRRTWLRAKHVFSHDFLELALQLNLKMNNVKGREGIAYFTFELEDSANKT